jgi:hypothetical protein
VARMKTVEATISPSGPLPRTIGKDALLLVGFFRCATTSSLD